MMMPHEVNEMLTLLREVNESLKALVAASEKPGQGGPKAESEKAEEPKRR